MGLSDGRVRVSADDAADICLTDWGGGAVEIHIEEGGEMLLSPVCGEEAEGTTRSIEGGMPFMSGGVLLVIGPVADWPTDEVLWRRWLGREAAAEPEPTTSTIPSAPLSPEAGVAVVARGSPPIGRWLIVAATAATTLLIAFAVVLSRQAAARDPGPDFQWVGLRARLEALPDTRLNVELSAPGVVRISGWLRTTQDRQRVAKLLSGHGVSRVTNNFLVTQEVAQVLAQSAGEAVHVRPLEIDRFEVTGRVKNIEQVRQRLHQALLDIGLPHSRLQDSLLQDIAAAEAISDAAFADAELRYRQLRDGSRLLQIGSSNATHQP
jgi:hypothetical protein